MLKHVTTTRRRTGPSLKAQMTAVIVGCTLVAGGVSAFEISMLNHPAQDTSVSTELVP